MRHPLPLRGGAGGRDQVRWAGLTLDRPRIMGILNLTPDSFSDGGSYPDLDAAIAAGLAMREAGADIVDVGGESTRPGAAPVGPEEEQRRVLPVITALAREDVLVSADTRNAATMRAALDAGAQIINDVSALAHDPDAASLLASYDCPLILMHMRGEPANMTSLAKYDDVPAEVTRELAGRMAAAEAAGIARTRLAVDPGFGFAKLDRHSLALLRGVGALRALGLPIVIGLSRKGFLGKITGLAEASERDIASAVAGLFALIQGAAVLRVHNVAGTLSALKMWDALTQS